MANNIPQDRNNKALASRMVRDRYDNDRSTAEAKQYRGHDDASRHGGYADRDDAGRFRSDDQSGRRRAYDSRAEDRDYHMSNRREDIDDARRYYADDDNDYRDRPGFGDRGEDDGRRAYSLSAGEDRRAPRERWHGAAQRAPYRPDLNDRQNGWQNGPRVESENDDRRRNSWRDQDR